MPPENTEQARWFTSHVLPHEPALRAWLRRSFPHADCVDDVIQDSYLRLLQARTASELRSPRALLFRIARNLVLDHLKSHSVARTISFEHADAPVVLDTAASIPETVSRRQEHAIFRAALESLPERCRRIVTLHMVFGIAQKDIAERLGVTASTVSDQLAIGLRKCTAFVQSRRGSREDRP